MKTKKLSLSDLVEVSTEELPKIKGGYSPASCGSGSNYINYAEAYSGSSPAIASAYQQIMANCRENSECCQELVNNTMGFLGNQTFPTGQDDYGNVTTDFMYSDSFLTTLGNEAYAVC